MSFPTPSGEPIVNVPAGINTIPISGTLCRLSGRLDARGVVRLAGGFGVGCLEGCVRGVDFVEGVGVELPLPPTACARRVVAAA